MFYTSNILGTNGLNSADVPLSNKQTIYVHSACEVTVILDT